MKEESERFTCDTQPLVPKRFALSEKVTQLFLCAYLAFFIRNIMQLSSINRLGKSLEWL